jgi:hypothetical protein
MFSYYFGKETAIVQAVVLGAPLDGLSSQKLDYFWGGLFLIDRRSSSEIIKQ